MTMDLNFQLPKGLKLELLFISVSATPLRATYIELSITKTFRPRVLQGKILSLIDLITYLSAMR